MSSFFNKVAIQRELADEQIHLAQAQRQLRMMFQITPHKAVFAGASFECDGTSVLGRSDAVFFGERDHAYAGYRWRDAVGPFTKREKFLSHVLAKIHKGAEQLNARPDRKSLLALNIESPDATLESDLLLDLRQAVSTEFAGRIEIVFLLGYRWLE